MTRYLRVRVGPARYLLPAGGVAAVGAVDPGSGRGRTIDARRLAAASEPGLPGVAVLLAGGRGRKRSTVILDEVEGVVEIGDDEVERLPVAAHGRLRPLFDGMWFDAERRLFQFRVDLAPRPSFGERRRTVRALAPAQRAERG